MISKKKIIASVDVRSSVQSQVMSKKKGLSHRRCSNFGSTSSDEQNKIIASADVRISARNKKKSIIASAGSSLS